MIGQINAVVFSFALWTYGWARGRWILHESNHTREQTAGGAGGLAAVPAGTAASEGPGGQPPATPGAAQQRRQRFCTGLPEEGVGASKEPSRAGRRPPGAHRPAKGGGTPPCRAAPARIRSTR